MGITPKAPVREESKLELGEATFFTQFRESLTYAQQKAELLRLFERAYVRWLILQSKGNVAGAARIGKMDRKHLFDLISKHELRGYLDVIRREGWRQADGS